MLSFDILYPKLMLLFPKHLESYALLELHCLIFLIHPFIRARSFNHVFFVAKLELPSYHLINFSFLKLLKRLDLVVRIVFDVLL